MTRLMYSFRRFSPLYAAGFDWVFHTHAFHVLMHSFLYAVLACLVASVVPRCVRAARSIVLVLALVGLVAALQETIQMTSERVRFGCDEAFDFAVDLNGGLLGVMLWRRKTWNLRTGECSGDE